MAVIGPGSVVENEIQPDPKLQDATQFDVIKLHNPLSDDFAVQVAQSIPVSLQYTARNTQGKDNLNEGQLKNTYGVDLRGPDQDKVSKKHVLNKTIIKAGQSLNFRGDVAKVAVRQLVNEIMQQRKMTQFLSDPIQRELIEEEIIIAQGSMEDLMNNNLRSVSEQINTAIEDSNEAEESFPGLESSAGGTTPAQTVGQGNPTADEDRKRPGRPRKS